MSRCGDYTHLTKEFCNRGAKMALLNFNRTGFTGFTQYGVVSLIPSAPPSHLFRKIVFVRDLRVTHSISTSQKCCNLSTALFFRDLTTNKNGLSCIEILKTYKICLNLVTRHDGHYHYDFLSYGNTHYLIICWVCIVKLHICEFRRRLILLSFVDISRNEFTYNVEINL